MSGVLPSGMLSSGVGLTADVAVQRADFLVRARLELAPGERVALLGPNGAGKSTLLGALAGTVPLTSGSVVVHRAGGDEVLDAPGRRAVPTHRRGVTLLAQRPLLFPHLDLVGNVAFGPRSHGVPRRQARATASEWLERVGLAERASQRPHRLSGGQQQRVAIARAFAAEPSVILLDEPFAALDAESTPRVRGLLVRELERTGTTALLVTHHLADAWDLTDRAVVLEAGRIHERTTAFELARAPRSRFGARLAGFGVVDGVAEDGGLRVGDAVLPGAPDAAAAPVRGSAALGIVSPSEVRVLAAEEAMRSRAVTATVIGVQVRAGLVRIEADNGMVAEVGVSEAAAAVGSAGPSGAAGVAGAARAAGTTGTDSAAGAAHAKVAQPGPAPEVERAPSQARGVGQLEEAEPAGRGGQQGPALPTVGARLAFAPEAMRLVADATEAGAAAQASA